MASTRSSGNVDERQNGDSIGDSRRGSKADSRRHSTSAGSTRETNNDSTAGSQLKVYPAYQTVKEGGTAVMRCRDEGATRLPVSWFKQQANRLLELRQSPNVDLRVPGRLEIRRVALSDAAVYLCRSTLDSITAVLSVLQGEILSLFHIPHLLFMHVRSNARTIFGRFSSFLQNEVVGVWPLDVIFLARLLAVASN